jgi:hypothetical protein
MSYVYDRVLLTTKEKENKKMTVKVELLNGSFISPMFDPEHSDSVIDYYVAKLIAGEILSYEVIG